MNYLDLIDSYREDMIATLQELIGIRSVVGPAEGDLPFGKDVHKAFLYMLAKARDEGFKTANIDNYGGHIEFSGKPDSEIMAVLGHLDVVPEGAHWDYPPFGGEIAEGRLYGRGAIDNKGPVVASYYAIKALKDAGVLTEKRVRLILGLDEEINWTGMKYYMERVETPAFGFTPDADFPVIHGEMGILIFELVKKINKSLKPGVSLRSVVGGQAANMVADSARAVITADNYEAIKDMLAYFHQKTGYKISCKGRGRSLEINTEGISSHGAHPEEGLNAISILMAFLGEIPLSCEDISEFVEFYNDKIGFDLSGAALGCGLSDAVSGNLILNVGQIKLDPEAARLTVNIRYPIACTDEQVFEAMMPALNKYNLGIIKLDHKAPIYLPKDSGIVVTLMDIYRKHTGDETSQPLIIGGGTYARALKNAVAYGATFPGQDEVAHQKNEYIEVDALMKATKIYAEAIFNLAKGYNPVL
jgi:succinyl-diaminopimelate desuccinylase